MMQVSHERTDHMAKYAYPAIFTPEQDGSYSINFPDLESCYTCGTTLEDGLEMARDVLALVLYGYEKELREIPVPSKLSEMKCKENEFINYVACDTLAYRRLHNNKSVKKTLTIPEWMNELAVSMNINFSQLLQDALAVRLGISEYK